MLSTGVPGSDSLPATRRIKYGFSQKDLRELCELCGLRVISRVIAAEATPWVTCTLSVWERRRIMGIL